MKLFDERWVGKHGIGRFAAEVFKGLGGYVAAGLPGRPSAPLEPLYLGNRLRRLKPGFFYSPGYNAPVGSPCDFAFTVHDLNHIHVPENSGPLQRLYYQMFLRPAVHRASVVLTVSEFSKTQICDWANVGARKVINVGNGVADRFCADGPVFGGDGAPYFACIGSLRPHKNFRRLLQAFGESGLRKEIRLVIVGEARAGLRSVVAELGLASSVVFLGILDDEELARVFRGALALVFPSTYEGFGLPIVEAMACGAPVITSNLAAMPEVAGDAAILVDPMSVAEIAQAMQKIHADTALRVTLSDRGRRRAAVYSWAATISNVERALGPWQGGAQCMGANACE